MSQEHRVGRRTLIAVYAREHGVVGTVLAAIWTCVAVGLVGLLVVFDFAHVEYGESGVEAIVLTVFIGSLLWLLSIVEGSELAVARLLGTDPQRLPLASSRETLERVQRDPKAFFNGRQALVVTSIVAITLAVGQIAKVHQPTGDPGAGITRVLHAWPLQAALVFAFPNFIVLWISQLYPKLRAAADAPGRFMLVSYQFVVRACMWIERKTRVGAPTSILGILRDRVLLTGVAADAVAMEPVERAPYAITTAPEATPAIEDNEHSDC